MELIEVVRKAMSAQTSHEATLAAQQLVWLTGQNWPASLTQKDRHTFQDKVREWADKMELGWREPAQLQNGS